MLVLALISCFVLLLYGVVLLAAERVSWYLLCPPITPKALIRQTDVQVEGVHVRVFGEPHGQPLLVCHGNAGNVDMWEDTLSFLGETHHVFVFDYRYITGAGRAYTESDLVSDGKRALQVLQSLRPATPWNGLAVSLGGLVLPRLQTSGKQALLCPLLSRHCAIRYHTAGLVPASMLSAETPARPGSNVETAIWLAERESIVPHECSSLQGVDPVVIPGTNHVSLLHDARLRRELLRFLRP